MDTESIERIVIAKPRLDLGYHEIAEHSRHHSDGQSRHRSNKTGCRRDGDESGNRSGNRAQRANLAVAHPLCPRPSDHRSRCPEMGRDEGAGSESARSKRAAGVESEPADPKQTGGHRPGTTTTP